MIDTNILQRGDRIMYGDDVVQVLSTSKTSIRVYNITKDEFESRWIEAKEFEYLKINPVDVRLEKLNGEVYVTLEYDHEVKRFNELWLLSER